MVPGDLSDAARLFNLLALSWHSWSKPERAAHQLQLVLSDYKLSIRDLTSAGRALAVCALAQRKLFDAADILLRRPEVAHAGPGYGFQKFWGRDDPGDDGLFHAYAWAQTRSSDLEFTWYFEIAWRGGKMIVEADICETHRDGQSPVFTIGDREVSSIDDLESKSAEFIEALTASTQTFDISRSYLTESA